jgi:hypothetical protein
LDGCAHLSFRPNPEQDFRTGSTAPTSHGALSIGCSQQNEPLVPLAEGEALWIGLRSLNPDYAVGIKATFGLRRGEIATKRNPSVEVEVPANTSSLAVIWPIGTVGERRRARSSVDDVTATTSANMSISPCLHGGTTTI